MTAALAMGPDAGTDARNNHSTFASLSGTVGCSPLSLTVSSRKLELPDANDT